MKYLCLLYDDGSAAQNMSKEEAARLNAEYMTFTDEIKKSGHYIDSHGLQPASAATTVRVRNGKVLTTDGPFAETKEQLGGYFVIEARDLNDAIQVASRIPIARTGSIEVRPFWG